MDTPVTKETALDEIINFTVGNQTEFTNEGVKALVKRVVEIYNFFSIGLIIPVFINQDIFSLLFFFSLFPNSSIICLLFFFISISHITRCLTMI